MARQPSKELQHVFLHWQMLSKFIPATYMMEISRGVILRSAGLPELWLNALSCLLPELRFCLSRRTGSGR